MWNQLLSEVEEKVPEQIMFPWNFIETDKYDISEKTRNVMSSNMNPKMSKKVEVGTDEILGTGK